MTFAERLSIIRREKSMTQSLVAEKLGVSFQAVSLWERGETTPEIDKLVGLAELFEVSLDWLLNGKTEKCVADEFLDSCSDRLFDEEKMYTYIKTYTAAHGLAQTSKVLPYAREKHSGQFRKGKEQVPYINHPLTLACHALALGLEDDDIISAALLHDVCEDCGVEPQELPVNDATKVAVALLTKTPGYNNDTYYQCISENPIATLVKLLDRCNNVSGMAAAFSKEKLISYIRETEELVLPLLKKARSSYPMYSNQLFVLEYHMKSILETLKHQA